MESQSVEISRAPAAGGALTERLRALAAVLPPEISVGMRQPPLPLTPTRSPQGSVDCPNLEFEYGDADGHGAELAGEAAFGCCVAINRCPPGRGKKKNIPSGSWASGTGDGYGVVSSWW